MKTLMKAILKDLDAFDKQGAKTPRELAEQQKRLNENVAAFREKWLGGKKADVADLLAFDQLQRRVTMAIEGGVSQAEVKESVRGSRDVLPSSARTSRRASARSG